MGTDESINLTVQHRLRVAHLVACAQVLDHLIRLQDVASDLVAPRDLPAFVELLKIGLPLTDFELIELGLEHLHRRRAILVLAALDLAADDDAGGDVGHADGAVGLVDVLAAGAAGAVGVDPEVLVEDFDLDVVVELGNDFDRGEAGLASRLGVEGADAHEAVHALLGLEVAVGVGAADDQRGGLDAGFFG